MSLSYRMQVFDLTEDRGLEVTGPMQSSRTWYG